MVRVQLYRQDYDYVYDVTSEGVPAGISQVSEEQYQEILDLPQVEDAAVYNRRQYLNGSIFYGNQGMDGCEMLGVDNSYFSTYGYGVDRGRTFVRCV